MLNDIQAGRNHRKTSTTPVCKWVEGRGDCGTDILESIDCNERSSLHRQKEQSVVHHVRAFFPETLD